MPVDLQRIIDNSSDSLVRWNILVAQSDRDNLIREVTELRNEIFVLKKELAEKTLSLNAFLEEERLQEDGPLNKRVLSEDRNEYKYSI